MSTSRRLHLCPRPACGERAAQLDQQSLWGEGDSRYAHIGESSPHPTEHAAIAVMPSPRKRGEGAATSVEVRP
jgi:hypothetical protein